MAKALKASKKKGAANRKSPLRTIKLQEVRFTKSAKPADYPSVPS